MAKTPYLTRRGNNFFFRIAIPADIRAMTLRREVTKTLQTQNYSDAAPAALRLASIVKDVFNRLRLVTDKNEIDALIALMQLDALDEQRVSEIDRTLQREIELNEGKTLAQIVQQHKLKQQKSALQDQLVSTVASIRSEHLVALKEKQQTFDDISSVKDDMIRTLAPKHTTITAIDGDTTPAPSLSEAIDRYISHYSANDKKSMFGKIKAQLPLFLEIVGDKPISELRQDDVINYFESIQGMPPRWFYHWTKGTSVRDIIKQNVGKKGLSEGTVKGSYQAVISVFLKWSYSRMRDVGFPKLETGDHIVTYRGDVKKESNKQRALRADELKRLFLGAEMHKFASNAKNLHMYWLPHIGLYTGARINEICQLNPQTDIIEIDGILCFNFTEETEADDKVEKSIKTKSSVRTCPVHSKLLALGFSEYLDSVKKSGAKRLFPAWTVGNDGKASKNAGKWFVRLIRQTGLRDETPTKKVLGFHIFRHTFSNHAYEHDINNYKLLTGHDDETATTVEKGYRGKKSVPKLKEIMEQFEFDIELIKPVAP